jgi:outer membrane autotransporter protein
VDSSSLGTFDTGFNQNVYTLLGGVDMSPNGGGSGFRFGAFGGYVQSGLNFDNYGTSATYTGGKVGGYAAYTQGGFYMDAQLDADFMSVAFNAPLGGGVTIDTTGTTIGVLANVGDRMYSGKNFFEPLASLAYANMTLGDQNVGGASVNFSNGESLRGGVGARVGTTMKGKDGVLTELSLLGRVWDEFSGNNTVTITDGVSTDTFTNDTSGLYGEVSGTVTIADTKTDLSTFLSGGAIFGSDSTTWNAKAGVRKGF